MKRQIIILLDTLPSERLEEVADFIEFLSTRHTAQPMAYAPIALGGLWAEVTLSDDDISEARRDMWHDIEGHVE